MLCFRSCRGDSCWCDLQNLHVQRGEPTYRYITSERKKRSGARSRNFLQLCSSGSGCSKRGGQRWGLPERGGGGPGGPGCPQQSGPRPSVAHIHAAPLKASPLCVKQSRCPQRVGGWVRGRLHAVSPLPSALMKNNLVSCTMNSFWLFWGCCCCCFFTRLFSVLEFLTRPGRFSSDPPHHTPPPPHPPEPKRTTRIHRRVRRDLPRDNKEWEWEGWTGKKKQSTGQLVNAEPQKASEGAAAPRLPQSPLIHAFIIRRTRGCGRAPPGTLPGRTSPLVVWGGPAVQTLALAFCRNGPPFAACHREIGGAPARRCPSSFSRAPRSCRAQ